MLSVTLLGTLMASLNGSMVLISLPSILRGAGVNPLAPASAGVLLWMMLGYMAASAVLIVACGRVSARIGRVRTYAAGFAAFALGSAVLFLSAGPSGRAAADLVAGRLVQGFGAALLFANSGAILAGAFPARERGGALSLDRCALIGGALGGLLLGGALAAADWRLVFLAGLTLGPVGTAAAGLWLREGAPGPEAGPPVDAWGGASFAAGLAALLLGVTVLAVPHGGSGLGWSNPVAGAALGSGALLLAALVWIERRSRVPLFRLGLLRLRPVAAGSFAGFLGSLAGGGVPFLLVLWLDGVRLPLQGDGGPSVPLRAAIGLLPLLGGLLLGDAAAGWLAGPLGARRVCTAGLGASALCLAGLALLPAAAAYPAFAAVAAAAGCGMGLSGAANSAAMTGALPAELREAGSGMAATVHNAASACSIGVLFLIAVGGLALRLPSALAARLGAAGLPAAAAKAAALPPASALLAALWGTDPLGARLGGAALRSLPAAARGRVLAPAFFAGTVAGPLAAGIRAALLAAALLSAAAAAASWLRERGTHARHPAIEDIPAAD